MWRPFGKLPTPTRRSASEPWAETYDLRSDGTAYLWSNRIRSTVQYRSTACRCCPVSPIDRDVARRALPVFLPTGRALFPRHSFWACPSRAANRGLEKRVHPNRRLAHRALTPPLRKGRAHHRCFRRISQRFASRRRVERRSGLGRMSRVLAVGVVAQSRVQLPTAGAEVVCTS